MAISRKAQEESIAQWGRQLKENSGNKGTYKKETGNENNNIVMLF